jgi:two-component system cell cycle response regulator
MTDTAPVKSRVLLVDDDPAILRILGKSLEVDGYCVEQAVDGLDALRMIEERPPDFLITDWDMPRLNGLELCRRVRQLELPHYVYVLFVTGNTGQNEMIAGLEAGADDFVTKPVNRGELLARLKAGLRVLDVERKLTQQAHTDVLTGIATRRLFVSDCRREFDRAKRYNVPLSCVMMDVDYFKRVNDAFGHPAGDVALREVARALAAQCRASDFICRYGGEEFAALLPETREVDAVIWSERVREAIAGLRINLSGKLVALTASFGVAQTSDEIQTPDQLIALADEALLAAKKAGRNRVVGQGELRNAVTGDREFVAANDLFQDALARDIMSSPVASLRHTSTVGEAVEYFLRYRISSAPVVDEASRVIGILSEQDCIATMISRDAWKRPIHEVMSRNVVCYDEATPVRLIYDFFCRVTLRRVILVRDGEPTGVISRSTLMRWLQHWSSVRHGWRAVSDAGDFDEDANSRTQIARGVDALLDRSLSLRARLENQPSDAVPILIEGTTQIQELCTDLLGYTRGPTTQRQAQDLVSHFL